ncbi:MAG: presqualene diphosphate synthase HpnD [Gammaproteobacteria bacterium]|nr:MAG: presqualene diphosphate synthase HpnD [Gammaproteobacteria bacterium]
MTPDQYCQNKAGHSGSSFYYSFLFLPPEKRRAITALYAFCREVDDVVDECREQEIATRKLLWWQQEVHAIFHNTPQHPIGRALQSVVQDFSLSEEHFLEIIHGMNMDLVKHRYATFDELKDYCYHAASAVGYLSARIFGYEDTDTREYAHDLGMALQLTNIIRDVGEDAQLGRIYLPQNELDKFGVKESDILTGQTNAHYQKLMVFQCGRADEYYTRALNKLSDRDRENQLPGVIMAAIYKETLSLLRNSNFESTYHRISLSSLRKLWIAWRTLRSERRLAKTYRATIPHS